MWFWALVLADIVTLKSGERLDGWVRSFDLTIEVAAGRIGVPWESIDSIDLDHESSVEIYHQMRAVLGDSRSAEVEEFLARWCVERGLNRFVTRGSDPPAAFCRAQAPRPLKVLLAPTWVPPLARIERDGSIVYPANYIPGPTFLGLDSIDVPYWQISPLKIPTQDLVRLRAEFSNEGLKDALIASRIVERERDVLLIPLNEGNLNQWRLIYSLAPKQIALPVIRSLRGD